MFRVLHYWFNRLSKRRPSRASTWKHSRPQRPFWLRPAMAWILSLLCVVLGLGFLPTLVQAQGANNVQQQEEELIREFSLPSQPTRAPVYQPRPASPPPRRSVPAPSPERSTPPRSSPRPSNPTPAAEPEPAEPAEPAPSETTAPANSATPTEIATNEYVLEFNRSPIVGNRLRLEGVYPETRLGFTRPLNWQVTSAKLLIRFQHSPTLLADRSSLMIRVNDTSVGSVPLDRTQSQVGQVMFNVPANLIQDYNEVAIMAEQQTSETCTNPANPTLWTEILPDSKFILEYKAQPIPLDFSRYPYPFFDSLSLDPTSLAYLRPKTYSEGWLTGTARFQTMAGRLVDFRPMTARLVTDLNQVKWGDRLIVIGTPAEQPLMADLSLPFPIKNNQLLDGNNTALPEDVGVLMLATVQDSGVPVLVATGNDAAGVLKAVQFLVQSGGQQIGAGQALTVTSVEEIPSPAPRSWTGYLPSENVFQLRDLSTPAGKPFEDVTVHGTNAPPVQISFQALPDDRFLRGSSMKLEYSYSPQVDPRTSSVEVRLDDVTIGARRLASTQGGRDSLRVNLPEGLVKTDSVLNVVFSLNPRRASECGLSVDKQLWGTLHGDTTFDLKRSISVDLPDLKLLQTGYPLTAPQDLSETAIVVPDSPKDMDVNVLLAVGERLGRLSQAESVKLAVYKAANVPAETRSQVNLVAIGTRDRFPIPEAFKDQGFQVGNAFTRAWNGTQVQALPDKEGIIKAMLSPWNNERILLNLAAQSDQGLQDVRDMFIRDQLFSKLWGDTVLISRNSQGRSTFDPNNYNIDVLEQEKQHRIERADPLSRVSLFLVDYWFALPTGIVIVALLLYGFSHLFIHRLANSGDVK